MNYDLKLAEILLVEDNTGDVELTKEAFEEAKFRNNLYVAENGDIALDYLYKRNGFEQAMMPDIIILDLNLPKTDGYEVLRHIKTDASLKHIPTIILTSSPVDRDIIENYDMHPTCYIEKPLDATKFLEVVAHIENFWVGVVCLPKIKANVH
jgi:CheY-like chemotaxis protein